VSNYQRRVGQLRQLSVAGMMCKLPSAHAEVFSTFVIENVSKDIGSEVKYRMWLSEPNEDFVWWARDIEIATAHRTWVPPSPLGASSCTLESAELKSISDIVMLCLASLFLKITADQKPRYGRPFTPRIRRCEVG
jgi:hypothetical protein